MAVHFVLGSAETDWQSIPVVGQSIPVWKLEDELHVFCVRGCSKPVKQPYGFRVFYADSMEEIVGAQSAIWRHSHVVVKRLPVTALLEIERERLAAAAAEKAREIAELDDGFGDDIYSTSSCQRASSGGSAAISSLTAISRATKPLGVVVKGPTVVRRGRVEKVVKNLNVEQESLIKPSPEVKVPPDLMCNVCHEMMKDAVLVPCCFYSLCRKCVVATILEQHKCPQCGSSKCKDADLLLNRNTNDRIAAFTKSNGIACDVATVSSKGSCPLQSPVPTISSEPGRGMSESKKASNDRPPVVIHLAPQKAPCTNVGVKRKAPQSVTQIRV